MTNVKKETVYELKPPNKNTLFTKINVMLNTYEHFMIRTLNRVYLTNILQNFDICYIIVGRSEAFPKKYTQIFGKKRSKIGL